jgi:uncharacterized membrane protein
MNSSGARRVDQAGTRVAAAGLVGLLTGTLAGMLVGWDYAVSLGWCCAAAVFLVWTWMIIGPMDGSMTTAHATSEDPTKQMARLVMIGSCVAALGGVGDLLIRASSAKGSTRDLVAALGVSTVAVSWIVVHTVFTVHYAHIYHEAPGGHGDGGGIDFNEGSRSPTYRDFAYLAFTIGMTYQVSDTDLTTRPMRSAALRHALLSYLFGALIVGATVNLVASLASSGH